MAASQKRRLNIDPTPMIKKLEVLVRAKMRSGLLGAYISLFKGVSGLEFDGYRDYTQDDDASIIDWKATARSKRLLVKEYVETKELEVFFLIDLSNSMIFGSTEKLKNEYASELALTLAYIILMNGDKVGYAMFNHGIIKTRRHSKGILQFIRMNTDLTNPDNHGGGYNLTKALEFMDSYIEKKGTMLVIISDFIGEKRVSPKMKIIANKFDTIAIMVRDPRDSMLPTDIEQVLIQDPYSRDRTVIDSALLSNFYETYVKREEKGIRDSFVKLNVDFLNLTTDREFVNPVIEMFSKRRTSWK